MGKDRERVHPPYLFLRAYQKKAGLTDADAAKALGMCERTYNDKVLGWSDFTPPQGKYLADLLGATQEQIFLT